LAQAIKANSSTTTTRVQRANQAAERIIPASKASGKLKMVVYGRNGMGKTHFVGTSNLKTLVIDCNEKGSETLADRPNVDIFQLETYDELDWIYWHLRTNKPPYEVVALDTISALAVVCMKWILGDEKARDASIDPLMPFKQHYGKLAQALNNVIYNWRNLPYVMIFLAQERKFVIEDEESGETSSEIAPSLTPAPLSTLLGAVGTIGRLYTRQVSVTKDGKTREVTQRRMLVGPHDKFVAKTRIRGLPRVVINPRLDQILAIRDAHGEVAPGLATNATSKELK
jgi:phage nucleotide-binding protein